VAEVFRGLHDIRLAVFLDGVLASVLLALFILVLYLQGITLEYWSAVLVSLLAAATSLFFGSLQFWRRRKVFRGDGGIPRREVVGISAPLFVTTLANYAINNFSLWIVAANLPADEVAVYGAAWRLVNLIALPITLMNMTVNPVIAGLNASNEKQKLQLALRGTATLAAIPAFVVVLGFIFFGSDILSLVFGSIYSDGSGVLVILSLGMLAHVWTGSCGQVLALTGHQRALMVVTVVTGLFSVFLAIVSVRYLGLVGVALAVAVGRVLQNSTYWLLVWRLTGLWTHGTLRPSFLKLALDRVRAKTASSGGGP
jgi:O-antigen/teichoic acid export membrane protein